MVSEAMMSALVAVASGLLLIGALVWWRIFAKAGYRGITGLLMLVPIVNIVLLLIFAFREWPIEAELKRRR